jgi:PAS domain S-box-containing protein
MQRRTTSSHGHWLALAVTLGLLLVFGSLVFWQWQHSQSQAQLDRQQRFELEVKDIGQRVLSRMQTYEMVLRGVAGLMSGSEHVTQEEWGWALDQLQLQERYPGIQALGWARYLSRAQLDDFLADIREQGRNDYQNFPVEEREHYLLIDYLSPLDWRNRRAVGFDMLSEPVRSAAVEQAIDTAEATLSAPVILLQETDVDVQAGVLFYLPVYRPGLTLNTVQARRAALLGTVHGAFRGENLIKGMLGPKANRFDIAIRDLQVADTWLVRAEERATGWQAAYQEQLQLSVFGRQWLLSVSSTPEYESGLESPEGLLNLGFGLSAVLLLALLIGGYLYQRERQWQASQHMTEQLREREERFRLLIERLPVATLLCNENGRIEMANHSAAELLGCSAEQLLGERVNRYLLVENSLAELALRFGQGTQDEEFEARNEQGESIAVDVSLSVLASGGGQSYLLNLVDLRARRGAEERFRLVVEASPNAIVLVDSQGKIAMVNKQTEQLFGYGRHELMGQAVEMLLPESLRHDHVPMRQSYQQEPQPRRMGSNRELFGEHRDGRPIPLEVGLSPIRTSTDNLVQAVIIDISERKATEQRLREQTEQLMLANRYKSEFLANMSHELRTPLNSILILSDQLRQNLAGNLTEKQSKHADIIYRAGSDLLQLINDVLDLAKVESGRIQLKLEALNMQELLVELDAGLRPMAELKGLRLSARLEDGVPRMVQADRVRLQQVLRNLLSNALKFTEQGEVILSVACEPLTAVEGSELLIFSVRDSGIGIAAEQHEQIFQAFQQIDGSTSRRFGGTGLGLAITRQLVQAMGGEISVQSAPGQGSCFSVRLPVRLLPEVHEVALAPQTAPARTGQGPTLLIVEDDSNFASVIIEQAHGHGFSCVHCRTGQQAQQALQREVFCAVILDILLPDISGWQLFRSLRNNPKWLSLPVHIISCIPQPRDWQDDEARYLVKPISRADLEQVFVDLLQRPGALHKVLLVEDVEAEREHYRLHLQQQGFSVRDCACAEQACVLYANEVFSAVVIDLDLPDMDGFQLLQKLQDIRSLEGLRVVINTGLDITKQALQRLHHYSAQVVQKQGTNTAQLIEALQGFFGDVGGIQMPGGLQGCHVLLVDDDVRNLYALSALLDEAGVRVTTASDGLEAIACYQQGTFDLILMDMAMPKMDGYSATQALKNQHGCQIPIIALTAHAMKGDREKCLQAGADDYLAKPVANTKLLAVLQRWWHKSTSG